jgi:uncharacterized protein (UPF0276 family)
MDSQTKQHILKYCNEAITMMEKDDKIAAINTLKSLVEKIENAQERIVRRKLMILSKL